MAKKQFVGTPWKILKQYVGAKVPVTLKQKPGGSVAVSRLVGVLDSDLFPIRVDFYRANGEKMGTSWESPETVRLHLKPFADLVVRLKDGTTPACEVYALTGRSREVAVLAELMGNGSIMLTYAQGGHNFINPDFLNGEYLSARAAEYLCGLGFPVGLKPGEYEELPATVVTAEKEVAIG